MGGIPFYLDHVDIGMSAVQNINRLCFQPEDILSEEFDDLYTSLFNKAEKHLAIIEALSKKAKGLTYKELIHIAKLSNAGSTTRGLRESKKLNASLKRMSGWIKLNRHKLRMPVLIANLNQKLRSHYAYYGITFNSRQITSYYYRTRRLLHQWLNHRGGKRVWSWEKMDKLLEEWIPLRNQESITAIA